jgi:hypothetical protein
MEPLSCNYNLTKDKVERAIELHQRELEILNDNLDSDERNNWELRDYISAYKTALAALDAVRWRDAAVEWPEEEMHMVVKISFISVPIVAYKPEKSEHVQLPNSYGAEYSRSVIKKYLPLPKWEEEAINRAFDDDHRGIGLTD